MKILGSLGLKVTFLPEDNFLYFGQYTQDLQAMGVECLYSPYVTSLTDHLRERGNVYNVVILSRIVTAAKCIDTVKTYCPRARIIFNTVDVHYLREQRMAAIKQSKDLAAAAESTKAAELLVMQRADCTIVISEVEQQLIARELPNVRTFHLPLIVDVPATSQVPFSKRRDIVFVGSYQHAPNVDAVLYFVAQIWPRVKHALSDVKFHIVGGDPPREILDLADDRIVVTGHVSALFEHMSGYRLSIAPLRYGAGLKGKVAMSLACGVPCVVTPLAAEGMHVAHGKTVMIADGEDAFGEAIVELYENEALWKQLAVEGRAFVREKFSLAAGTRKIMTLLSDLAVLEQQSDREILNAAAARRSA